MGKQQHILCIILILFVLDKKLSTAQNVAYLQLSSTDDQRGGSSGIPATYNSLDALNGFTLVGNNAFRYEISGHYFALITAQAGSNNGNGRGEVHVWARPNNQSKPNSNNVQTVGRGSTSTIVYPTSFPVNAGRVGSFIFSVFTANRCASLDLLASTSQGEPAIPSFVAAIIQLSLTVNGIPFAELTSSETQLGDPTPRAVRLNTVGASNRIGTASSAADGTINFIEAGVYFMAISIQAGSAAGTFGTGNVHAWMRVNGTDVPNSNGVQTITRGSSANLVSYFILTAQANDRFQTMFSTTNPQLGLIALAPANEPAAPSIIMTATRLDTTRGSTPYAQVSSLRTQFGCITPTVVQLEQNDNLQGITNNNGILQFTEAGTYFVVAAAQTGSCNNRGIGDVHVWMQINGQDVQNSNSAQSVNRDTSIVVTQAVMVIQAGDRLQMMMSTDVTTGTLGLVVSRPNNAPAAPSISVSVFRASI